MRNSAVFGVLSGDPTAQPASSFGERTGAEAEQEVDLMGVADAHGKQDDRLVCALDCLDGLQDGRDQAGVVLGVELLGEGLRLAHGWHPNCAVRRRAS